MMNDTRSFDRRRFARAALTLILALCLCLSVLPAVPASASAQDDALNKLVSWGVMSGYPDGSLRPGNALTRAEFVALVNRAYGYKEMGSTPFVDVPYTAWYSDDISIAYNAGYFSGTSATTASPGANLTREQAMTLLARSMRLDSIPGEVTEFSDGRSFSTWSRGYVKAAYQKGLIGGYTDGSFKPGNNITRGEMAMLLSRALGNLIHEEGEHTLGTVYGNVTINTPNATLYDTTIAGDLYITGGLGLGSVVLDNVRVLGSIIVAGGGESEAGQDSVVLRNVKADELKIDSLAGQYLSLRAEGETVVTQTLVRSDAYIQDRTQAGRGLLNIALEGANGKYTLSGNLETVVNKAPGSTLKISRGTLTSLTIDETAVGSKLEIYNDATVKEVNLDTAVNVTGSGDIGSLNVNAAGSSTSMLPDDINIRPGITADIYGETMDTELGNEASSDPRILAGYPKAGNVGPNTMTATVATNKSGTLYWAVSSITDGSVGEQGLLSPASYGSKAVKYGTLQVGKSNTEFNISVTGLTTGGNYYFSAMLVDVRNDHSPVKVVSFSTPDNTVPAFASGYPALTLNSYHTEKDFEEDPNLGEYNNATKYFAQFSVKATKNTKLYWATYTKGSTAPTAAEFRSGALAGAIKTGNATSSQPVDRNEDVLITVTGLRELSDYDIYFWLCDADGVKSSAVKKLTFKTVDGTPPVFNITPQHSANPKANSIPMTTNVNEAATVYWVAVLSGTNYPVSKPANNNSMDERDYQILQIVNGINGLKSGKITVKANTDASFTISGLTAETAYDIWYVAKDTAGNYSEFNKTGPYANVVTEHTLDTSSPTVTQEFSKHDTTGRPYPDTDIILTFSEDVLGVPIDDYGGVSLWELWQQYQQALKNEENAGITKDAALRNLTDFLERTIHLMYYTGNNTVEQVSGDVLDYKNVVITRASDGKGVVLRFKDAVLDSGTTYRFDLYDLADTSLANNTMAPPNPYKMEEFITVSSNVILTNLDNLVQTTINNDDDETSKVMVDGRYYNQGVTISKDIIIDAAFSLRPEATAREDPAKEWDMIIWSDASITFELYRRYVPSDGEADEDTAETNDKITMAGKKNQWEKLPGQWKSGSRTGAGTITISSTEAGSSVGLSLFESFDDFKTTSTSQRTNHYLRNLDEGATYEYAIHITSLNGISEDKRDSWSGDVKFQINIVAGSGLYSKLTNTTMITESDFSSAVNGDYQEVDDISESLKQRLPFQISVHFEDKDAPKYATDAYPAFFRSDTSLQMSIQLDRKGTIYWYAAPVGSLLPDYRGDLAIYPMKTTDNEDITVAPDEETVIEPAVKSADRYYRPRETKTATAKKEEWILQTPTIDRIYNPTRPDPRIRYGTATADTLAQITIPDLDPSTMYYVYIVLRGEALTSYSEYVMLYRVATMQPDRPILELTRTTGSSTSVDVHTMDKDGYDMDTTVNWLILQHTNDALVRAGLADKGTDGTVTQKKLKDPGNYNDAYGALSGDDKTKYDSMTLLEALYTEVKDKNNGNKTMGTVFDLYASNPVKDDLSNFIDGAKSEAGNYIVDVGSLTIPTRTGSGSNAKMNYTLPVDCDEHGIAYATNYIFLASARNAQITDRGYRAFYDIRKEDTDSPYLMNCIPSLEYNDGNKTVSGKITLTFDKPLYYRPSINSAEVREVRTGNGDIGGFNDGLSKLPNTSITWTPSTSPSLESKIDFISPAASSTSSNPNPPAQTFVLDVKNIRTATIVLSPNICNASGNMYSSTVGTAVQRIIKITVSSSTGKLTVTCSDWHGTLPVHEELLEDIAVISVGTENASVPVGASYAIETKVSNSVTSVEYVSNNTNIATVSRTGTVTGVSAGTVTITAIAKSGTQVVGQATCTVTVTASDAPTLTLDQTSMTMAVGGIQTLTATPKPASAASNVTWSTSDSKIATVSTTGIVRAIDSGTVNITATATIDGKKVSAVCKVTVTRPTLTLPNELPVPTDLNSKVILTLTTDLDASLIKDVNWTFTPSDQSTFTIDHDGGPQTQVGVIYKVGGNSSVKIQAKITTVDGAQFTSNSCTLTVKK